jgi:tetratricopeptide (TPR) repeat protein
MATNPTVYCLETITDYFAFERLCHDLMALEGYPAIEPLGRFADKGRDAIHVSKSNRTTIFAYSVREDWRAKLAEDANKIKEHNHTCDELVFISTAEFSAGERDEAVTSILKEFGWELKLYGIERLRILLDAKSPHIKLKHPQIFPPQFLRGAESGGGLLEGEPRLAYWNLLQPRNPFYTGRTQELSDLQKSLDAPASQAGIGIQVLCGLGGIGKTQLALEYAYQFRPHYKYIFWLRANSAEVLESDYSSIWDHIGLPVLNSHNRLLTILAVKEWLEGNPGWLLIFDDATDLTLIENYIPSVGQGHIILTSRMSVFDNLGIKTPLSLGKMTAAEAEDFLIKRISDPKLCQEEVVAVDQIARELDYLPLALEQAGAYISKMSCSCSDYLASFRHRGLSLLEKTGPTTGRYPLSVMTTWSMNFAQVEAISPASAEVLRLSSFLGLEMIPYEIFILGANNLGPAISQILANEQDSLYFYEILEPLAQFSLIRKSHSTKTFDVHRLVQSVIRAQIQSDAYPIFLGNILQAILSAFPNVEFSHWSACDRLIPHIRTCTAFIEKYGIDSYFAGRLYGLTGTYLHSRGQLNEAADFWKRSLAIYESLFGDDCPKLIPLLTNLGEYARELANYGESESLHERALSLWRKDPNQESEEGSDTALATIHNNLGELYRATGRYDKAESSYKTAVSILERLPDEQLRLASVLNNLSELYHVQGQRIPAKQFCARSLEIRERLLDPKDPSLVPGLINMSNRLRSDGHWTESEEYLKRALSICERTLGSKHPHFSTVLNNLGALYNRMGKYDDAENFYNRSLEIEREIYGEYHPSTALRLSNLASFYQNTQRPGEAKQLLERAIQIREEILGPDHPDTIVGFTKLAYVLLDLKDYEPALQICEKQLGILEGKFGSEHLGLAPTIEALASTYKHMGNVKKSLKLFQRALGIRMRKEGRSNTRIALCLNNIGVLYEDLGEYKRASQFYKQALEMYEKYLGEDHPDTINALVNYAGILSLKLNRKAEADKLQARAAEIVLLR